VKATVGHVRDLPEKKLGIDIEKGFAPEYVTIAGKEKTLAEIKEAAHNADEVYIATDPDREGEAIGWHVAEQIKRKSGPKVRRVLFHEYTKDAVRAAMEHPRDIDSRLVDAQQARRVLDRLVGYKASPILWKTVKKGLSAGRVQTVALRLLVERERDIRAFKPQEYWKIAAAMEKDGQRFTARLHAVDDHKVEIQQEAQARSIVADVERLARASARAAGMRAEFAFPLTEVKRRERRKNPAAPFTTSTLQQEAAKKLGYGSKRIMRIAQSLYEGADLGDEGAAGLITYMRTDSTRVAESAAETARDVVRRDFGTEYLASGPQLYLSNKQAANTQDAHECIRPTDPARKPDDVKRYLKDEQFRLYQLIWQRFMASQMAPAIFDTTTLDFTLGGDQNGERSIHRYLFRATGSIVKFPGFLALYRESREEGEGKALEDEQALPVAEKGELIAMLEILPTQHFTEPPPRFSEASLVKELEKLGADHLHAPGPALRQPRAAPLLPHGARGERRTRHGEAIPRCVQRGLHVRNGRGARSHRGRQARMAASAEGFLEAVRIVAERRAGRVTHRRGARLVGFGEGAVSAVRRQARAEGWILRAVRRLRESSEELQVYATDQGRAEACRAHGAQVP
jgi:DNA topoisomerase-1